MCRDAVTKRTISPIGHIIPIDYLSRLGFELTASAIEAPYSFWKKKGKIMSKNMDTKKDGKKKPAKSLKEKRAEKKGKKETKK